MEYHNGESPVEATQACQEGGACGTVTGRIVSLHAGEEMGKSKEQILLIFTTAWTEDTEKMEPSDVPGHFSGTWQ